ncbi:DnaJ domain protein [Aspergillus heteromorphus CBS 117.55]|uniref:DnaJ domain protein n=1 Tax=Aspergillus heteromorphus CBS 117.55 TaxID=1448321 RepID=A0A317VEY6_9EURO|nr:DnaJ domain protein [Aspergillus heteromorphus CBS 117.55]PWY70440.1 DnaJ domain protein [Aspergillus heteromorphus CBS 117.55]
MFPTWRAVCLFLALAVCLFQLALAAEDYYKTLGLDKSANERDIKRAYRNLSKKFHPDKNPGDESAQKKFVEIAEAYDVLSTAATRKIYDQYGHEGVEQHRQGGSAGHQAHDPFDLFSRFFGGGGHFGHAPGHRRGPDQEFRVGLPLRDFYNGRDFSFMVEKQQICDSCEGTGSADREVITCDKCSGRGVVIQKHQLAPGMFQQVQMHCDKCGGQGKMVKKPCPVCHGHKVLKNQVETFATVEPGMGKGTRIVFENEADESPDWIAGDLVIVLDEKEPEVGGAEEERTDGTFFRRKGKDLFWKEALSLREAWMGEWTRNITHLDGHVVRLGRSRGQVVQPLSVETVSGEGMPFYSESHLHDHDGDEEPGNLYVEYTVVLPDQMESGMEKDFFALWEKWRKKNGVDLAHDSGRPMPPPPVKDEL